MTVNPDVGVHAETRNNRKHTPKNAIKEQPTENQKNSKYQNIYFIIS